MSQGNVRVYALPLDDMPENPSGGTVSSGGTYTIMWNSAGITGQGWSSADLAVNNGSIPGPDLSDLAVNPTSEAIEAAINNYNLKDAWLNFAYDYDGDGSYQSKLSGCVTK